MTELDIASFIPFRSTEGIGYKKKKEKKKKESPESMHGAAAGHRLGHRHSVGARPKLPPAFVLLLTEIQ